MTHALGAPSDWHPGYVSGEFIGSPASTSSNVLSVVDTLYLCPLILFVPAVVRGIGLRVFTPSTGGGGQTLKMGLYSNGLSGGANKPVDLLAECVAEPSTETTGDKSADFAADIALNRGLYWGACLFKSGPAASAAVVQGTSNQSNFTGYSGKQVAGAVLGTTSGGWGWKRAFTYGALPAVAAPTGSCFTGILMALLKR